MRLKVAVIDGQGGGIGGHIIKKMRRDLSGNIEIFALGTNALATAAMMKAGADHGASGENAIIINVLKVDCILGAVAIIAANSMLGEITPGIAEAIAKSPAQKMLLPLNTENIKVVGIRPDSLPDAINMLVSKISKTIEDISSARSRGSILTS
jgi:hypothetical protein